MYRKRSRQFAAPVAMTTSVEQQTGQKAITLSGREYLQDIVASALGVPAGGSLQSQFQTVNQSVNPSDSTIFSWLSGIASKFEEYRFNMCAFVYEPTCNTYTTGSVGVFFDPDVTNAPPATWQTFTNTGSNTHGAPWAKHTLVLPPKYLRDRRQYYVKDQFLDAAANPPVTSQQTQYVDPLEYFLGSIGYCSQGVTCANSSNAASNIYSVLGKLYIEYSITLMKATLDTPPRQAQFGFGVGATNSVIPSNYVMGPKVSSYWASLSGNGLKIIPDRWQVTGPIFGVSVPTTTGTVGTMNAQLSKFYGDQVFDWKSSIAGSGVAPIHKAKSGVVALQTLDLMYVVCMAGTTVDPDATGVVWAFANQNQDVSSLSGYSQSFATTNNASGGCISCGTMHIQAGETVSLILGVTTLPTAATSFIWLLPCTWGLDQ